MTIEVVHVVTVKCDVPICESSQVCGESEHYAEQTGWKLAFAFGDSLYDLCPNCFSGLEYFLNVPHIEPKMDLKKILAGEQPYPEDAAND